MWDRKSQVCPFPNLAEAVLVLVLLQLFGLGLAKMQLILDNTTGNTWHTNHTVNPIPMGKERPVFVTQVTHTSNIIASISSKYAL